jgi:hypothetical protein
MLTEGLVCPAGGPVLPIGHSAFRNGDNGMSVAHLMTCRPTFTHDDALIVTWGHEWAPATAPATATKGSFNYPCARAYARKASN